MGFILFFAGVGFLCGGGHGAVIGGVIGLFLALVSD